MVRATNFDKIIQVLTDERTCLSACLPNMTDTDKIHTVITPPSAIISHGLVTDRLEEPADWAGWVRGKCSVTHHTNEYVEAESTSSIASSDRYVFGGEY